MRRRAIKPLCALMLVLATDATAGAQPPACSAEGAGLVACIAGRLCGCGFARGGPATGLPDGFRWDCGILRPTCGPVPAMLDPSKVELPDSLAIDRSNTIIQQGAGKPQSSPRR